MIRGRIGRDRTAGAFVWLLVILLLAAGAAGAWWYFSDGLGDHGYGPADVSSIKVTKAPGVSVEVLPVHRSLAEKRLACFDVAADGAIVVLADGILYDVASGERLNKGGPDVRRLALTSGTIAVVTADNKLALWEDGRITPVGPSPVRRGDLAAAGDGRVLLFGSAKDGRHALLALRPGGRTQVLAGSPVRITAAAADKRQTWFAAEESLFQLLEPGRPLLVLDMPEPDDHIVGLALHGGTVYFSTRDAVYVLKGALALPLAIGIGGRLRATDSGIVVLDYARGHLYRVVAAGQAVAMAQDVAPRDEPAEQSTGDVDGPAVKDDDKDEDDKAWWSVTPRGWVFIILLSIFMATVTEFDVGRWLQAAWITAGIDAVVLVFSLQKPWLGTAAWSAGALVAVLAIPCIGFFLLFGVGALASMMPRWLRITLIVLSVPVALAGLFVVFIGGYGLWVYHVRVVWGDFGTPGAVPIGHMITNSAFVVLGLTVALSGVAAIIGAAIGPGAKETEDTEDTAEPQHETQCAVCDQPFTTRRISRCPSCGGCVHRGCLSQQVVPGGRLCKTCAAGGGSS
jgi:hypothetical protein